MAASKKPAKKKPAKTGEAKTGEAPKRDTSKARAARAAKRGQAAAATGGESPARASAKAEYRRRFDGFMDPPRIAPEKGVAMAARRKTVVAVTGVVALAAAGVAMVWPRGGAGTGGGSGGGKGPGGGTGGDKGGTGEKGGGGAEGGGGGGEEEGGGGGGADGDNSGNGGAGDDNGGGGDKLPACPVISLSTAEADAAFNLVADLVVSLLPYAWVDAKGNLIGGFVRDYVPTADYYADAVSFEAVRGKPNFAADPSTYLSTKPCKFTGDMQNLRDRIIAHFNTTMGV